MSHSEDVYETMVDWWNTVRTLAAIVQTEYKSWEGRRNALDLAIYLDPIRDAPSPPVTSAATSDRLRSLQDRIENGAVLNTITSVDLHDPDITAQVDATLAIGAVVLDIRAQSTRAPCEEIIETLAIAVDMLAEGKSAVEELQNAAERTSDLARLVPVVAKTLDCLPETTFGDPRDDAEAASDLVQGALSKGDLSAALALHRVIVDNHWDRSDFDAFGPRAFERLVIDLYEAYGYHVHHQDPGPDGGIDAIAQDSDSTKLIQVKHKSAAIGAPTFDQYVALLQYYDPDEVVLVTSSSFTDPALARWRRVADSVRPIDGEQLRRRLSAASIAPPLPRT